MSESNKNGVPDCPKKTDALAWSAYYEKTRQNPPSDILLEALKYVGHKGVAIDIGAGALKNTKYLLQEGFDVTAIDKSPSFVSEASIVNNQKLTSVNSGFENFNFGVKMYDIAVSAYSLPFCEPLHFSRVLSNIKSSLKEGGIFCGQLFGINDTWANNRAMNFHTRVQVEKMFADMEIISLIEEDVDGKTALGESKHWHVFHIIARKKV